MANPAVQLEADATKWLRGAKSIFLSVVDNYAFAQAIANDDYRDDYVTNDFFYYCVTKSTKV